MQIDATCWIVLNGTLCLRSSDHGAQYRSRREPTSRVFNHTALMQPLMPLRVQITDNVYEISDGTGAVSVSDTLTRACSSSHAFPRSERTEDQ